MKKDESEIEQEKQELKRANSQYYSNPNSSNRSSLVENSSPSNLRNSAMLPNSIGQKKKI